MEHDHRPSSFRRVCELERRLYTAHPPSSYHYARTVEHCAQLGSQHALSLAIISRECSHSCCSAHSSSWLESSPSLGGDTPIVYLLPARMTHLLTVRPRSRPQYLSQPKIQSAGTAPALRPPEGQPSKTLILPVDGMHTRRAVAPD